MPTLEELLRESLKGANEKFDPANKAIHAAVVKFAKGDRGGDRREGDDPTAAEAQAGGADG